MSASSNSLQIVILGGTGDLSTRKLLPALFDLYCKNKLPSEFSLIGIARRSFSDIDYRSFVLDTLNCHGHSHKSKKLKQAFLKRIFFISGSFTESALFAELKNQLQQQDAQSATTSDRLFYLAVPPSSYQTIFQKLHSHSLHQAAKRRWSRLLVEKPFGHNTKAAQALDQQLGRLFEEDQIFRIDHYLAKEAVQNILSFRFANTLINGSWNKDFVEAIAIKIHESVDVGTRGAFYDGIGAIRDMGQNHLLQLLAVLTMEEPERFDATHIRKNRLAALQSLQPHTKMTLNKNFIRAQYKGYQTVAGVAKDSETETFFQLHVSSKSSLWKGVPFYISTGKALDRKLVEVIITFKDITSGLFVTESCNTSKNEIRLTIEPTQQMHVTLNAKEPGLGYQLESRTLSFDCGVGDKEITNSYERVLLDCIRGDQTLFTTTEEVVAQWKYITPILKHMHNTALQSYQKGSRGPKNTLL